jgi:hypothetical protein
LLPRAVVVVPILHSAVASDKLDRWWWQYFDAHGVECRILPLPTNEANKSFDLVFEITRQLEEFKLKRCVPHASHIAALVQQMLWWAFVLY